MATESIRMAGASQLSLNSLTKRTQAVPEAAGDNSQGQINSAAAQARAEPSTTVTISPRARELAAARNEDENNRNTTSRTGWRVRRQQTMQPMALLNAGYAEPTARVKEQTMAVAIAPVGIRAFLLQCGKRVSAQPETEASTVAKRDAASGRNNCQVEAIMTAPPTVQTRRNALDVQRARTAQPAVDVRSAG